MGVELRILADMFGIAFFNASKDLTENHELYDGHIIKLEKTPEMKSDSLTESESRSKTLMIPIISHPTTSTSTIFEHITIHHQPHFSLT